jgi:hypothetical protein
MEISIPFQVTSFQSIEHITKSSAKVIPWNIIKIEVHINVNKVSPQPVMEMVVSNA